MILQNRSCRILQLLLALLWGAFQAHAQPVDSSSYFTCVRSISSGLALGGPKRLSDFTCTSILGTAISPGFDQKALDARFMHRVEELFQEFKVTGKGENIGIWDAGYVLSRHFQLNGRVKTVLSSREPRGYLHEHATFVAGAMGSKGEVNARQGKESVGMAPSVGIFSYFWEPDLDKTVLKAAREKQAISVSNHSYNSLAGWDFGNPRDLGLTEPIKCDARWTWYGRDSDDRDVKFGLYSGESSRYDEAVWYNKSVSVFVSAGNERNWMANPEALRNRTDIYKFNGDHCVLKNGEWQHSKKSRQPDTIDAGFNTMVGSALGKNVITIGAAIKLTSAFDPRSIDILPDSSMGPTSDGRVKPDLVADGNRIISTYLPDMCLAQNGKRCAPSNVRSEYLDEYTVSDGTSAAAPAAAGIAVLLNELGRSRRGRPLFADEMRAVLVHTAISPTRDGAPTYKYGWGLIDALGAGQLVAGASGSMRRIAIDSASQKAMEIPFQWKGKDERFRITVTWLDEPKAGIQLQAAKLGERSPVLVNQIAAVAVSPSKKPYFPWSLDVLRPQAEATRKQGNSVDNIQKIDLRPEWYEDGQWILRLDFSGVRSRGLDVAVAMD